MPERVFYGKGMDEVWLMGVNQLGQNLADNHPSYRLCLILQ